MSPPARVWTTRRRPVALLALAIALAAAAVLALRLGAFGTGRTGPAEGVGDRWRDGWQSATERLPVLADTAVLLLAGAAAALLAALWLLLLTCTPARRWWVMDTQEPGVYAELDRRGVALLLRDSALAVPGVTAATVRLRRRGFRVRATAAFGELDRVERQLTDALDATCDVLGVVRRPRLTVTLTPSGHWIPPLAEPPTPAQDSPPAVKKPSPEGS